ncbi:MAG TPA: DUF3307 domain-containing protein [Chitinophagaceae bacterium]|nr:DUF3307 domain-containing protein [Chitinophagaceae bacterium]
MTYIWLTKLLFAHLLTDFFLQRKAWIEERNRRHFASPLLYLHTFLTAGVAWLFIGWSYWGVALVIFGTHTLIDGWKSYMPPTTSYFLFDQLLHLLVLFACRVFTFTSLPEWKTILGDLGRNEKG